MRRCMSAARSALPLHPGCSMPMQLPHMLVKRHPYKRNWQWTADARYLRGCRTRA
ncbi:hypothetical protein XAPC_2808 [Xanthomonas citri pv. punicae str. LMG 859]|nr:hypothetical protein XAPC_2808 [Xanthomonas citri pv. punicae str. LMG 859]